MKHTVFDPKTGKRHFCNNKNDLYRVAFDISLRDRAAVYIRETDTTKDIIDDLRGNHCTVERA